MKRLLLLFILAIAPVVMAQTDPLGAAFQPSTSCTQVSGIWLTDTMTKIIQSNSTAGTGCFIQVRGTQGEFVDFQVQVVAPSGGYAALNIVASGFTQAAPDSSTPIPAPDSTHNNVLVYREWYTPVTTLTAPAAGSYYTATGNYPDALIPTIDPYFHQTTNAFPVAVTANQTQAAWVDVLIPPTAKAGYYSGTITVSNSGTTLATMPVIIAVWQWPSTQGSRMPATATLPSQMQYGGGDFCNMIASTSFSCTYHGQTGGSGSNLADVDGAVMFLDHRWTMNDPIQGGQTSAPFWQHLWDGNTASLTSAQPMLVGAKQTSFNFRSGGNGFSTQQAQATNFGAFSWPNSSANFPGVVSLNYSADEPGNTPANWTNICSAATTGHAATPPLPQMVASKIEDMNANSGQNCVDIMTALITLINCNGQLSSGLGCASGQGNYPVALYTTWLAGTNPDGIKRSFWIYTDCFATSCGGVAGSLANFPMYNLDAKPANNRAMEWMNQFLGATGELYFYSTCLWESSCGGTQRDGWVSGWLSSGNNGDGTLAYPSRYNATSTEHVSQPGGARLAIDLWIPSVRLKHMRDGMQDYEYMNALNVAGQGSLVTAQVNSWITNAYTYEFSGAGLQAARTAMGNALHALSFPQQFPPSGCAIQGAGPNWSCQTGAVSTDLQGAITNSADGAQIILNSGAYTLSAGVNFSLTKGNTFICTTPPSGIGAATTNPCTITVAAAYAFGLPTWTGTSQEKQYFPKPYRVSGFTFTDWPIADSPIYFGSNPSPVNEGVLPNIRVDHNSFAFNSACLPGPPPNCQTVNIIQMTNAGHRSYFYGSIDHNLATCAGSCHFFFGINGINDPFPPPNPLGTLNNLFIEDNTITSLNENSPGEGAIDHDYGTQPIVWRHNTTTDNDITSHFTMLNYEFYNNLTIKDAGSPNGDCYRAFHSQTNSLGMYFNNVFTCNSNPNGTVLSLGSIRESYGTDPRAWPRSTTCSGFVSHQYFVDGNRPPSGTNQGYPCLWMPTRDQATGALVPYYAWNVTASGGTVVAGTYHAVTYGDSFCGQNPDFCPFHVVNNRDIYQTISPGLAQTAVANCTDGAGVWFGPLAFRPTNCPAYSGEPGGGFGYAAQTVTGTIGSSASGTASDTVLYQCGTGCSGSTGWTTPYKPAPYPNPWVSGAQVAQFPTTTGSAPGAYTAATSVTFSCPDTGAVLYVTTDGTAPTHATPHTPPFTVNTIASGQETVNALCSLGGSVLDSLTWSGGYYIAATAFNAWPSQPGSYPTGTFTAAIQSPGQNTKICMTFDGTDPSETTPGTCNNTCAGTAGCSNNSFNQFQTVSCTASCTVKFLTTGVGFVHSPITQVQYTIGGTNGLWWDDIGGPNFSVGPAGGPLVATTKDFGNQAVNVPSGLMPLYLNNANQQINGGTKTSGPTQISAISISDSHFTINTGTNAGTCGALPINIPAQGNNPTSFCTMTLQFLPTAPGTVNATMTITDTAAGSPHVINLTGTGTGSGAPAATLTPTTLAFGNQLINTTSGSQLATLSSTGSANLVVSNATVGTGFNIASGGSCPTTFPFTLTAPPTTACTFAITFSPLSTISYNAQLSVTDNAGTQTSALTGTGTGGNIAPPTLSPLPGAFSIAQAVTVTTAPPNTAATICYTINGVPPTTNGAGTCTGATLTYSGGAIAVPYSLLLQVIATQTGFTDSTIVQGNYQITVAAPSNLITQSIH